MTKRSPMGWAAMLATVLGAAAFANESAPVLNISPETTTHLNLTISNLTSGATYYLEWNDDPRTNTWAEIDSFEGAAGETNLTIAATLDRGFFRAIRDPYHAKVGQVATFETHAHGVAGTAHILNNRTIELRDFTFDGQGINVQVIISPNSTFSPYVSLSDNLVGTAFTNDTMTLELPEGTDLAESSYISVWCVPVGVSFGEGEFQ